ncbi:MAG: hypothetical protein RBR82_06325 [Pseudomonas sp.]|nr:hypothetical protein [Pseudomonas sp.]
MKSTNSLSTTASFDRIEISMPRGKPVVTFYYGTQQVYCINYDAKVNLKTDSLWITGLIGYFPVAIGGNNG